MFEVTYIGTDADLSPEIVFEGVTYTRDKPTKVDAVHPWLAHNSTFKVKEVKETKPEPKVAPKRPLKKETESK